MCCQAGAERRLEHGDGAIEEAQVARQLAVFALLADVRVPTDEIDSRHARSIRPCENFARSLGKLHDRRCPAAQAPGIMAVHHLLRFACDAKRTAEQRVVAVEGF